VCERIPYLILPVRQLSREPFGIRRSATSEPSGKTPGPSRSDHCAEAPRASRRARRRARLNRTTRRSDTRASHRARHRARLEPSAEAIHERAVGQDARPVSIQTIRRSATSEPSGNTPGPSRSEPSAEAIHDRSVEQAVAAEPRAIRRSSRSQRAPQISNRTP